MRISDWSSDVCSSDLHTHRSIILACLLALPSCGSNDNDPGPGGVTVGEAEALNQAAEMLDTPALPNAGDGAMVDLRSEEHTSELQSLMRISYAVFCLNKKKEHDRCTILQSQIQQHTNTRSTEIQ